MTVQEHHIEMCFRHFFMVSNSGSRGLGEPAMRSLPAAQDLDDFEDFFGPDEEIRCISANSGAPAPRANRSPEALSR